jgi:hypothetical protein
LSVNTKSGISMDYIYTMITLSPAPVSVLVLLNISDILYSVYNKKIKYHVKFFFYGWGVAAAAWVLVLILVVYASTAAKIF